MHIIKALILLLLLFNTAVTAKTDQGAASGQLTALLDMDSATTPRLSPDGSYLVFTRWSVDWMKDRWASSLWVTDRDGGQGRELGQGRGPSWSPDGTALAYLKPRPDGTTALVLVSLDPAVEPLTLMATPSFPRDLQWSPDGRLISFRMGIPGADVGWPIDLPPAPEGAQWAPPPHIIKRLHYRLDGLGYHYMGYEHLFVVNVKTGELRQLTNGNWHVGAKPAGYDLGTSSSWSPDSLQIYFDGVAHENYESVYGLSNIYSLDLESGAISQLDLPQGFWINPRVSPDGESIAFAGFKHQDKIQTYTAREVWTSATDGTGLRMVSDNLDRDADSLQWSPDNDGVYFSADHNGTRQIFFASREAEVRQVTKGDHAVYLGNFDRRGMAVASLSRPNRPSEIVSFKLDTFDGFQPITDLNGTKLAGAPIGKIEGLHFISVDGTPVQGWLLKPADFDSSRKYPLILEIHGGPHEMYHWGWSAYFQGLASQGFLVLYSNPRGSSGYGTAYGNAIDNAFPGDRDREDLMAAVESVSGRDYVDAENVFVTGCSAGGTLTLWLVAHSDRFRAASANCVISNFLGYAGTADVADWSMHRFKTSFWEDPQAWLEHSPLMKAGQINTPTLFMTGEKDLRTPIAQAEQMYSVLLARGVPTRLVRFPTEAHGTTAAPSNMMRTILYITDWFEKHGKVVEEVERASR